MWKIDIYENDRLWYSTTTQKTKQQWLSNYCINENIQRFTYNNTDPNTININKPYKQTIKLTQTDE